MSEHVIGDINPDSEPISGEQPSSIEIMNALERISANDLGQRIKQHRVTQHRSQSDIVAAAGKHISISYLSRIETGSRKPSLEALQAIGEALGVDVASLLGCDGFDWGELRHQAIRARINLESGESKAALRICAELLDKVPSRSALHLEVLEIHALALESSGQYIEASQQLEQLAKQRSGSSATLKVLTALARCYRQSGDLGSAIAVGDRADELLALLGMEGTDEAVRLRLTVAAAYIEDGRLEYAKSQCEEALEHAKKLDDPKTKAMCYWEASIVESKRGNTMRAAHLGQKALHVLEESNETRNLPRLRTQTGLLLLRLSPPRVEEAMRHLKQAHGELLLSSANPSDLANNQLGQAQGLFLQGKLKLAEQIAMRTLASTATGAPFEIAALHVLLGQIAFQRDETESARDQYRKATYTLYAVGVDRAIAQLWFELGGLLKKVGCLDEALDAFQRAGASTGLRPTTIGSTTGTTAPMDEVNPSVAPVTP